MAFKSIHSGVRATFESFEIILLALCTGSRENGRSILFAQVLCRSEIATRQGCVMQLKVPLRGHEAVVPHELHQHHAGDVCIGQLTGEAVSQPVNVQVRQAEPLAPSCQSVLDCADRNALFSLGQEERGVIVDARDKILGIELKRCLVYEKRPSLAALPDYLSFTANLFLAVAVFLRADADGIAVQLAHLRDSQPGGQEQADQYAIAKICYAIEQLVEDDTIDRLRFVVLLPFPCKVAQWVPHLWVAGGADIFK